MRLLVETLRELIGSRGAPPNGHRWVIAYRNGGDRAVEPHEVLFETGPVFVHAGVGDAGGFAVTTIECGRLVYHAPNLAMAMRVASAVASVPALWVEANESGPSSPAHMRLRKLIGFAANDAAAREEGRPS